MNEQQQTQFSNSPVQQRVEVEVSRLVNQYGLGKRETEYGKDDLAASITVLIIAIVLGTVCLAYWSAIPFLGFIGLVIILIGIGIFLWINPYPTRYSRGYLYENGLILVECLGKQIVGSEAIHWCEIATIWYWVTQQTHRQSTTTTHHYRLQRKDNSIFGQNFWQNGRNLITNNQGEISNGQLGTQVEQAVLRYLLPPALSAYKKGDPVSFGALLIEKAGIHYNGQFLPWSMFKQCKRKLMYLSIQQKGKWSAWAEISYKEIANLNVLCHLIARLTNTPLP